MIYSKQWAYGGRSVFMTLLLSLYALLGYAQNPVSPGTAINFSTAGNNTASPYTTSYVLTDNSGNIMQQVSSSPVTAPNQSGVFRIYAVNYNTSGTAPTLTAGTNITAIGGNCKDVSSTPVSFTVAAPCVNPGTAINFTVAGNNTASGYTTKYVLTDASGVISQTVTSGFQAPATAGTYKVYAVNYTTSGTAPTLTVGTNVTAIGGTCASVSTTPLEFCVSVPAATPVASVGSNPTSPGTSTGSVSLTGTSGAYPANTPVSVTYTTPSGGTAVYTGTTTSTGTIVIPNLPAGTYGPFVVSVNGGPASNPSNPVTLVDPAPVASVKSNPTTPGGTDGVVSLTSTAGVYPASTPVSVTYTTPSGTTAVYTGTTDATGHINIPNLPAGTYTNFVVSVNGGGKSTPSNSVTLVDPAATPVASGSNPTSPGTSTGSVSLTGTSGAYPANTPVSVTYTTPSGTTAVYTGTTTSTGTIVIPNLPAGTYGPFVVSVNGGPASNPSNPVTLVDPAPVASVKSNPTTPGGTDGVVSLTSTAGVYPASTPVSVTYTTPSGTTAVYTGTTDGSGKINIPNLPAGTYTNFVVSVNGGGKSTPSNPVTLVDPAATPVASGSNPTSPGTSTGSVSLTGTSGAYPASTPVSVTYTTPSGTTAVYTGTSTPTGTIVIPNLPAGTYGPFVVSVNGGPASNPSNPVTLVDPAPVASVKSNPTTPAGTDGVVSLTSTAGLYPVNTPVSVTYTTPGNTTATYAGNTDATGHINIPGLPAGTYTNFVVSVNGGGKSTPSNPVTLVDPAGCYNDEKITNGGFNGNANGWNVSGGGWTYSSGEMQNTTENAVNQILWQDINPALTSQSYKLTFKLGSTDQNNTNPNQTATLEIKIGGISYATFTNGIGRSNNVTLALANGATSTFTPYSSQNVRVDNDVTIYIPHNIANATPAIANQLHFVFNANGDDFYLDNISLLGCAQPAATPVASVGNQPTSPGTSTGSISLTGTTGAYPANTPVSVTYTTPSGTTATYTGTTTPTGTIVIPNLPAGTYGPFVVSVNGGPASNPSNPVTLVDPAATPVASVVSNPTTPGGTNGVISLTGTTGAYPANTPVSVTYTTPSGTTATYTGTTTPTGTIVIPGLPAGTYGPFVVSVNGGPASNPSNNVTLVDPAATPVATGSNPTSPGTSTGSVSLTGTSGAYPANTPVSVTYTTPSGTTATYTGTTTPTGTIVIPNLPAGTYGPFVVSVNGGPASNPSNTVTLVDPTVSVPDLTPIIYARPSTVYGSTPITVVVDVLELLNVSTSGLVTVRVTKDAKAPLSFDPAATTINGKSVQNSQWAFDGSSNPSYYVLTTSQPVPAGNKLSFGLSGTLIPGATSGSLTVSAVIAGGSGGEVKINNNADADRIDYFQQ